MNAARTSTRYSTPTIWLHWIMFLLIVAVYATIELREFFPKGSDPRDALKALHFMLGLSVLFLLVVRILARLQSPTPAIEPPLPVWQHWAAITMHMTLYVWMVAMPILGWLILSGEAKPIPFFGLELPPLIAPDKDFAHNMEELHETLGEAGYWLIGIHAAAALFHHYFIHDNTLDRMSLKRH